MDATEARKGKFDIDYGTDEGQFSGKGMPGLPGFTYGNRWNGWACPYFDKAAADQIIAAPVWGACRVKPSFDAERNVYCTPYEPEGDEVDEWNPQTVTVDGVEVTVWAIGNSCWTWQEV